MATACTKITRLCILTIIKHSQRVKEQDHMVHTVLSCEPDLGPRLRKTATACTVKKNDVLA